MSNNKQPSAPFWMVTFSDMMSLLVVFFVLILSMSQVKVKKFREALTYFKGGQGVLRNESVMENTMQPIQSPFATQQQAEQFQKFTEQLREHGLEDKVQVDLRRDGIHTVITDSVMFDTGEARLIEPARTILRLLADAVTPSIKAVAVEGHTDNWPIRTYKYPSNWELSAARAASVVRFLQQREDVLSEDRYVAIGYGEYHPVASNASPEGRAKNRRVEILLSWESWQNKINPALRNLPKQKVHQLSSGPASSR